MLGAQPGDAQLRGHAAEEEPQRVVHDAAGDALVERLLDVARVQLALHEPERRAGLERLELGDGVRLLRRRGAPAPDGRAGASARCQAASARSMRGTARPPCAPARASAAGASLRASAAIACSRSRSSWPSSACAGPCTAIGAAVAEHAHDLVPEGRGSELEAVVVGRAAHEREMLVDARQGRREQEAIALLLPRPVARQAGRRERAPQLGRARGLGGLAAREHALLEPAQDERAHGREPGQADADDAHAAPRQPVAQAHLHGIQRRQHVVAVGLRAAPRTARPRSRRPPRARGAPPCPRASRPGRERCRRRARARHRPACAAPRRDRPPRAGPSARGRRAGARPPAARARRRPPR